MKLNKTQTNELRIALGNALMKLNTEILDANTEQEKIIANKICLKFIDIFLSEIGVDYGKTR